MALDLLLARHGQTDWNPTGKVMGRHPVPLNDVGRKQAMHLRDWLQNIEIHAIYSSPMLRAKQTAEIISESCPDVPIIEEEGVAEIDYGKWVGMTYQEVAKEYKKEYEDYRFHPSRMKIPGGEDVLDVQHRAVHAVERIRKKHEGERVLVVSHADVIKAILVHYLDFPLDLLQKVGVDNGSLAIYRFGTEWGDRLVALNYFADVKKILPW